MASAQYFTVTEIPDPQHAEKSRQFGDIGSAVALSWERFSRTIAEMESGSVSVALCFFFSPSLENGTQGRLRIWLKVLRGENIPASTVGALVKQGPVAEFYDFTELEKAPAVPWKQFKSIAEILRRYEKVPSYIKKTENDRVPPYYNVVSPFSPNTDNDYMGLDRQLSGLDEPVYYEILIRPTDVREETAALYLYLSNLSRINESDFTEAQDALENLRSKKGFRKDRLAEDIMRKNEEIVEGMRKSQLEFSARVCAPSYKTARLVASNIAESACMEGSYRILFTGDTTDTAAEEVLDTIARGTINHDLHHIEKVQQRLKRLPRLAGVEELSGFFRFPVSHNVSPRTIRKNTDPQLRGTVEHTVLIGDDMETGLVPQRSYADRPEQLFDQRSSTTIEHRLDLEAFKKHMFISGVPGSGKTTAVFNLLLQLYRYRIPFFALEPAKTEYRILKTLKNHSDPNVRKLGETIKVYTPGNEYLSPLRFNPMAYPEGISLDEHINNLMHCFKAAMPMEGPLPALLSEAVELVYGQYDNPHLADLVEAVRSVMEEKNYDTEIKSNIETAISVRLSPLVRRSMGKIFVESDEAPSFEELLNRPVIVEMDALDQEQANLLTLFLLTSLREYIKTTRRSGSSLQHVIVLEEAHNIVARVPDGGAGDQADPREKASRYISRMLAELRALGEGMIIADQLPSTVDSTVIKNTGTKLAHRLTSMDDREELGYTMLAGDTEIKEFARLKVGEAFYYTEGLYKSRRVRGIDSTHFFSHDQPPDNEQLYRLIHNEPWFRNTAVRHLREELDEWVENFHTTIYPALQEYKNELNNAGKNEIEQLRDEFLVFYNEVQSYRIEETLERLETRREELQLQGEFEEKIQELHTMYTDIMRDISFVMKIIRKAIGG